MKHVVRIILELFFLSIPIFLIAQSKMAYQPTSGSIMGTLFGPDSLPVSGAHIIIKNGLPADVSNKDGHFELSPLPDGAYTLKITHVSYFDKILKNIQVNKNSITQTDTVFLQPRLYREANVIVTASRHEQAALLVAQTINQVTPLEIYKRNSATTAEALREEEGVFIQKTKRISELRF